MRRRQDWPGEATAPDDLPLLFAFVNTTGNETNPETWTTQETLATWLERQGFLPELPELDQADLERALAARRGLRALLAANSGADLDTEAVTGLDQVASQAVCRVRFEDDGTTRFEAGSGALDGVFGRLFAAIATAQLEGRWPRLKICANKDCRRAFYDASNNRRGRWCSTRRCGNRINASTYRRRYKQRTGKMPRGGRIPGLR